MAERPEKNTTNLPERDPIQIYAGPRVKPDNPLMKVREPQLKEVLGQIDDNSFLILGVEGRSGSTSFLDLTEEFLKKEGVKTAKIFAYPGVFPEIEHELDAIISQNEQDETPNERECRGVIFIDEAQYISDTPPGEAATVFKKAGENRVRIVFLAHDRFKGKLSKLLDESLKGVSGVSVGIEQLESADREQIGQIFDTIISSDDSLKNLSKYREEIIDFVHSPQQLMHIIEATKEYDWPSRNYARDISRVDWGKFIDDFMFRAPSDMFMKGVCASNIETTGGDELAALILKVGENGIPEAELMDEDVEVLERYKKFHYFEKREGEIKVRGIWLVKYLKTKQEEE